MERVRRQQAVARRQEFVTPGGATTFISTYIGTNKMELLALGKSPAEAARELAGQPMAYLVEQAPGDTVDPHYHAVEQFQVFIGGTGRIGTHALQGVTVHYAGAHSPYGPIVAGPDGIQYVTLRRDWDPGAQWMPGAAEALRAIPGRRHAAFTSSALRRCHGLEQMSGATTTLIMDPRERGAGAWQVCAGPGAAVRADAAHAGGRFWYVLAGSLLAEGVEYDGGACFHQAPGEAAFECCAGSGGVELVEVQFCR